MAKIIVEIDKKNGSAVKVEAQDVKGASCDGLLNGLTAALGGNVIADDVKPEFWETEAEAVTEAGW